MKLSEKLSMGLDALPFKCRPLAFLCAVLLLGLFCFIINLILFTVYALCILIYALYLCLKHGKSIKSNPLPYIMTVILLISALLPLPALINSKKVSAIRGEHTVTAVIEQVYYEENFGSLYYARLTDIDGKEVSGYTNLEFEYSASLVPYDTVTLIGEVSDAEDELEAYGRLNIISKNICTHVKGERIVSITNQAKQTIGYSLFTLRKSIEARLYSLLSFDTASYASALLPGERSNIPSTLTNAMSALGISHILAVSGMHLSVIALFISLLAEKIGRARKTVSVLVIAGAIAFSCLAGFSVSVMRACIMLIISMLSVFSGRKADSLTSLLVSGAILCIAKPQNVISCGFLLSFFATLGIILCALYAQRFVKISLFSSKVGDMRLIFKFIRWVALSLLVSLCASLFTIPVTSLYFSSVSFFSVFANLFAVPMASISLIFTFLTLTLGSLPAIGTFICLCFNRLYGIFYTLVVDISDTFETEISLRYPFFVPILILLACLLLFLAIRGVKNPLAVISAFLVCTVIFLGCAQGYSVITSSRSHIVYHTSPTAEGFSVISGDKSLYIDVGNGSKALPTASIKILTEDYYETALDGYMLTHYHSAHIGTLINMLEQIKIKSIYLPTPETPKELSVYNEIKNSLKRCEIIEYLRKDKISFGDVQIFTTERATVERSEHPVISMRFLANSKSIVYIGSSVSESNICADTEKFIADSGAVICGRHGPITKENNKFLSYSPEKAVYLSPYEDIDEHIVFSSGSFTYINSVEGDKVTSTVFSLS